MIQSNVKGRALAVGAWRAARVFVLLSLFLVAGMYSAPAGATGPTVTPKAVTMSVINTSLLTPQGLLNYLNSLSNGSTQQILSGQHSDNYAAAGSGTYGNLLDQFLPATGATPANATINDHTSGNTNLTPAILGVEINSAGTCGSKQTYAQTLALAQGWVAAGGIVQVSFGEPSPTLSGCNFANRTGSDFPAVITPGTTAYNTYMYGTTGRLPGSGRPCTAASPCGGVWAQAQAIRQIPGAVIFRTLFESNLAPTSWWWGTNGTSGASPTNAQFVTLFQQTISYIRFLGVTNMLVVYNVNQTGGTGNFWSANDPGSSYRDLGGVDIYGPTTQAGVISDLENTSGPVPYLQSLGIPLLLNEVGSGSGGNPPLYTYDNSIWDSGIRAGASHVVGTVVFDQKWCLSCQLNALGYLQGTITRSQLPRLQ